MKPIVQFAVALSGLAGIYLGAQLIGSAEAPAPLSPGVEPGPGSGASLPGGGTAPDPTDRSDARPPGPAGEEPPAAHREPTPEERARIFAALEVEKERRRQEQARARVERQEEEFRRRAEVIADRLSLSAGSAAKIAELFSLERAKIAEIREELLAAGRSAETREHLRTSIQEVRSWRDDQLASFFGWEVAKDIAKFEDRVQGEEKLLDKRWKPTREHQQEPPDGSG